ncbi:hypothetical protein GV054_04225 [Marinomonas mediterranea]|uniref:hypothetical protein n=1 Tax=Marinomonas mediterranea TaxID=119864 RepID=UPI00234941F1|nr:hypothetical protein [Marinomonas mediterranea]WCN12265.1 hypothetical protein GV054_04225 [Marinomonas mediterranea]
MSKLTEHFPLSHYDELPIHQSNGPIRTYSSSDPRAFDRYWFTTLHEEGDFMIISGFGTYPNIGTVEAFAMIIIDGKQTTLRAHRPMSQDRADLNAGPIRYELVGAFREWRLTLDDNDQGFTFDLRWRDTKRAIYQKLGEFKVPGVVDFKVLHDWGGYETFGRIEGTFTYQGKTYQVDPAKTRGVRDHHWGTRDDVAGFVLHKNNLPFTSYKGNPVGFSHFGQWVEFKDWSLFGHRVMFNIGDQENTGSSSAEIIDAKLRFDPDNKHLIGGVVTNKLANGEIKVIHYEAIGYQCAYLRAGCYTGCNGLGTPDGDIHHGTPVGELISGETYNLMDPTIITQIEGFENLLVRATCDGETSVGLLESKNPAIHAMASKGILYSLQTED